MPTSKQDMRTPLTLLTGVPGSGKVTLPSRAAHQAALESLKAGRAESGKAELKVPPPASDRGDT